MDEITALYGETEDRGRALIVAAQVTTTRTDVNGITPSVACWRAAITDSLIIVSLRTSRSGWLPLMAQQGGGDKMDLANSNEGWAFTYKSPSLP